MNKKKIGKELLSRKVEKNLEPNGFASASVLIPLLNRENDSHILFTKRSKHVKQHEGEVSFPGGILEEGETPEEAVLRETEEEIGIPSDDITILGRSPSVKTQTSGYIIFPYVGYLRPHPNIQINESEVKDIFEVPIEFLKKENERFEADEDFIGEYYLYKDYRIWGATARVLKKFLDLVFPSHSDKKH